MRAILTDEESVALDASIQAFRTKLTSLFPDAGLRFHLVGSAAHDDVPSSGIADISLHAERAHAELAHYLESEWCGRRGSSGSQQYFERVALRIFLRAPGKNENLLVRHRTRLLRSRRKRAEFSSAIQISEAHKAPFFSDLEHKAKRGPDDDDFVVRHDELSLRSPVLDDAIAIASYLARNRAFLKPYEPTRDDSYFQASTWQKYLAEERRDRWLGRALRVLVREKNDHRILAMINFSGSVPSPMSACFLGFSCDQNEEGKGHMTRSLGAILSSAATYLGVERIMANHLPHNHRSRTLLEKLGFEEEGRAKGYLEIDGRRQEHVLRAKHFPRLGS